MMTDERRAEIERAIAEAAGPWFGSKGVELSCMARIARELLAEIDRPESAERLFGDALSLLSAAFASNGPCKGLIRLGQSYINDGIPAMVREIIRLRGEVVELKESLVSRSELAATTIAGLEMENARLRAENESLNREAGDYLTGCNQYRAELDALYRLLTCREGSDDYRVYGPGINSDHRFRSEVEAAMAIRKAAGLDPVFGSPVPPADGGPDA